MTSGQVVALLLDLALVLALCQAMGLLARRLSQPPVVGEIVAGVLLGPTLFHGWIADTLFPLSVRPMLSALANVGVALFMFLVGTELDHRSVRAHGRVVGWVSTGSLVVPFGLGTALGMWLRPGDVRLALFLGTAMAVTAFPVLARIINDRGLVGTRVGAIALASAAVGDVVAWTLLAVIVAAGGTPWRLLFAVPYLLLMTTVVRKALRDPRVLKPGASSTTAIVVCGVLLSGGLTELMGLHFIFGAFLFGLVMPKAGAQRLHTDVMARIGQLATLFLPVYFVVAGFGVDLSTLDAGGLGLLGLILVAAMGGKFAGVYTVARLSGMTARPAGALATLMNTRGLTELVLLTVGRQAGLLDTRLYSLMVAMAVLTTVMSGPLLRLFLRRDETVDAIRRQDSGLNSRAHTVG
jgi:Kef-type K+ transport system membrane component KefB